MAKIKLFTSSQKVGCSRLPPIFTALILAGLAVILGCTTSRTPVSLADHYQDMFDPDLFNERVELLNSIRPGAAREDLLQTLGAPQVREAAADGAMTFIYRVRCYMGPELLSRWPRHVFATYEARFIMDPQGRVAAIQTDP